MCDLGVVDTVRARMLSRRSLFAATAAAGAATALGAGTGGPARLLALT